MRVTRTVLPTGKGVEVISIVSRRSYREIWQPSISERAGRLCWGSAGARRPDWVGLQGVRTVLRRSTRLAAARRIL